MAFIRSTVLIAPDGYTSSQNRDQQTYLSTEFKFTHIGDRRDLAKGTTGDYPPNKNDYPIFEDNASQNTQFRSTVALSGLINTFFGNSVAIGNDRVIVGAPYDTADGTANKGAVYIINPNYSDATTSNSGPFNGVGFGYSSFQKITRNDSTTNTLYGWSVSCACNRIAVGTPQDEQVAAFSGAVFLYDISGNLIRKLTLSDWGDTNTNRFFGASVSIGNGRVVVGTYNDATNGNGSGAAYIYDLDGNKIRKILPEDGQAGDSFGWSVSVGSGRIVIGAPFDDDNGSDSGSAYIFDLAGNQIAKIKPPTGQAGANFGRSVAVGQQRIVVGSPTESFSAGGTSYTKCGAAYIFGMNGTYLKRIVAGDPTQPATYQANNSEFGLSVAIGDSSIIIGRPYDNAGRLYHVDLNGVTPYHSSNALAFPSFTVVTGSSETYGISCSIGNGITCVGGSGRASNGAFTSVEGKVKIGKSFNSSSFTNYSLQPLRGLQTEDPVARHRDIIDCLDEK
jgi:hypothetical protein